MARNCATRVCCVGLLVKAGCAVIKGWLMRGRVAESPPARRCALPRPNAEARRRRLMVRPLADDTASERTSQHKRLTLQKLRSEEHTSELQSHGLISYAVFCLK